jgi:hypothetical protein
MMMVAGAVQILFPENGAVYLTCALLCALLATGWADCDTRARGITILPVLYMLYFIFWPGGAVVYLLYRSGLRGLMTAVIHGLGLAATFVASFYATFYGLHFAGLLDSRYYR